MPVAPANTCCFDLEDNAMCLWRGVVDGYDFGSFLEFLEQNGFQGGSSGLY